MLSSIIKVVIVLLLVAVIISLGAALVRLVGDRGQSDRTVRALTVRICLSIGLFLLIVSAVATGILHPG